MAVPAQPHIDTYLRDGEERARSLENRGPIRFGDDGKLHPDIVAAYRRCGFYVLENALASDELTDLDEGLADLLARAPSHKGAETDRAGRPAVGAEFTIPVFRFARPLSDPHGGTDANNGRHPVKMSEPQPAPAAPESTLFLVYGIFQVMDSCLRLYGHPSLLKIAETFNGADFTPFTDSIWIKEPGLGISVAWHQDGTTHWDHPNWDEGIHGFNFMAQLCRTTAENSLWIVPGSHKLGKVDIKKWVDANSGSDRLPDAVPMLCERGDVAICNRQSLHGSYANTSPDRRVSIVFGFHRRDAVLNATTRHRGEMVTYDAARIHENSRVIQLAIDARAQRFPQEPRYVYEPLVGEEDDNRWSAETREKVLKNYNVRNLLL